MTFLGRPQWSLQFSPPTERQTAMAMIERVTDLWAEQLKNLHSLEIQMATALPAMALAARAEEVQEFFRGRRVRAKRMAVVLEQMLAEVDASPDDVACGMMCHLVSEWDRMTDVDSFSPVDDVMLLRAVRQAIHHKIARYAKAVNGARVLGYDDLADLLQATLDEEIHVDAVIAKLGRDLHCGLQRFVAA